MKKNNKEKIMYSKYFLIICCVSIVLLLISNITSVKIIQFKNIVLPSSALLFPLSYIIGDVIAEVYGYKKAQLIIIIGFIANAFMVLFFALTIILPSSTTWMNQEAYKLILGITPRMFIASLSAYLVGSLSNAYVMNLIKKCTKEKYLFIRTISSTIVGEFLDTLVFVLIGFSSNMPKSVIISMIICQFVWKVSYEIIATPFTYFAISKYKKLERI